MADAARPGGIVRVGQPTAPCSTSWLDRSSERGQAHHVVDVQVRLDRYGAGTHGRSERDLLPSMRRGSGEGVGVSYTKSATTG